MSNFNIPILMYHSIESAPKNTVMRSLNVHPRSFKLQMFILNLLGYKALSIKNLMPYLRGEKFGKVVGMTFDDGYKNNLTNAAPVLKKYNFNATCYIVTERIGSYNKWDIKKGIQKKSLMTKKEIQEWLNFGMDIGAHSGTHKDLTILSPDELFNEVHDSKVNLEKYFNISINDFCYPFGRFDELSKDSVQKAGFITATSMSRGRVNSRSDIFSLPRIPINYRTLPHLFIAKILTSYEDRRSTT